VGKNQHRWKAWIEDVRVRKALEEAAEGLEWSWGIDKRNPKNFPLNTWFLFIQIDERLKNKPVVRAGTKLLAAAPPPEKLSDLVKERTIKAAYEDHHEGSYEDALRKAATGEDEGYSAWRKIMRAVDLAYVIRYHGLDSAPIPRLHFLHGKLLEIADSKHLRDLSLQGIVEFFDDVCPCGKKHQADAIRKLRKRRARVSKGQSLT
jgi:hypothetical protein